MESIEIEYLRFTRTKEITSFPVDTEIIDLSGQNIFEIDLSQIRELDHLRTLKLSQNRLENVDISDFSVLRNIQHLDLSNNKLLHFDTAFLEHSSSLKELRLNRNLLKRINLGSMERCSGLELLDISYNHIHTMNLSSLESCKNLRELNLGNNQLDELDLKPISNAQNIEIVDISHNWIRSLDTEPLMNKRSLVRFLANENPLTSLDLEFVLTSPNIDTLLIDWTQIQDLDLSPLRACRQIRSLGITQNKTAHMDLYPLLNCELLESINISGINSISIDIWPLFGLPHLRELNMSPRNTFGSIPFSSLEWPVALDSIRNRTSKGSIKAIVEKNGFGFIREQYRILHERLNALARYHLRNSFIESFNLHHLRGFDGNPIKYTDTLDNSASFAEVRSHLDDKLSVALIRQVREGGSTHFIDLERVRSLPVLAVLAPKVIGARQDEIACTHLIKGNGFYDTTPLWYTAYGQEILNALEIGLITDAAGVERIQNQLRRIGFDAISTEDDCSEWVTSHLSDELKAYLRFLAIRCYSRKR